MAVGMEVVDAEFPDSFDQLGYGYIDNPDFCTPLDLFARQIPPGIGEVPSCFQLLSVLLRACNGGAGYS
ncbi:hypothetical protein [Nitrosovibrio sp. Nv4]